jgi:exodeoxyribonuclease VIII
MPGEYTAEQLRLMREFNAACEPTPPEPLPGGISFGIAAERYHRRELGVVSKSALDEIARSPAHYRAWVDGIEREPTPALRFGTALHMAILEPARFAKSYAVKPDFGDCRFKENKARRDAWESANAGRLALSADDEDRILGMLAAVQNHPTASRLVAEGQSEVTLSWADPITGLRCKSRADYWVKRRRMAVDLKSTEDASPEAFAKSVYNYRYHVQDALYRDAFRCCGEPIDHFAILAVEKSPPYACAVYVLDQDAVAKGFAAARQNIERLADCMKRNEWPAYSDRPMELSLPHWAA